MYLPQLSNAFGVSSVESDVRKIIIEAIEPHADSWRVDTMGNLFVTRNHRLDGPTPPLRVMLTAHMDEVGFLITKVQSSGLLKFQTIGGFDPRVLPGRRLVVGPERIPGIIGVKPIHLLKSDRTKVPAIDSLYIDVGADSDKSAKVKPGQFAAFDTEFAFMGEVNGNGNSDDKSDESDDIKRQGRVKGKALDNRVGCALLIELLQGDYPVDLIGVFTVQEEVGLRGARVAAYTANPDLALVLECTAAADLPRSEEAIADGEPGFPRLGDGPALTVMDRTFIADRRLLDLLQATAQAHDIPYQFKRPGIGGTDAGAVHLAREGAPTAVVSVPARYIHAPAAVLELADFWTAEALLRTVLAEGVKGEWR